MKKIKWRWCVLVVGSAAVWSVYRLFFVHPTCWIYHGYVVDYYHFRSIAAAEAFMGSRDFRENKYFRYYWNWVMAIVEPKGASVNTDGRCRMILRYHKSKNSGQLYYLYDPQRRFRDLVEHYIQLYMRHQTVTMDGEMIRVDGKAIGHCRIQESPEKNYFDFMVDLDFDTPLERLSAGNTSLFAENQRHWNVDAFFRELWCRFIKNQYRDY